jgi:hypothetical protein
MAFSPSKSLPVPCNPLCLILVFFIYLLVGSCTATRPGMTTMLDKKALMNSKHIAPHPEKQETGFEYHGKLYRIFRRDMPVPSARRSSFRIPICRRIHTFFPKGMPMPPFELSNRHDLVVASTQRPCFPFFGPLFSSLRAYMPIMDSGPSKRHNDDGDYTNN